MKKILPFLILLLGLSWLLPGFALTFALPKKGDAVVGHEQVVRAKPGDTLSSIGKRYDIGYYEMVEANPSIGKGLVFVGERVLIPSQFILPNVPRTGIVIDLDELRLYYYPPNKKQVVTYPLGIGRVGWATPAGKMTIIGRRKSPIWNVPESIRKFVKENKGIDLPKRVLSGPDNPLGNYALRLSDPTYLIHGTNEAEGVGRRVSSGCIRLFNKDIAKLYQYVKINTQVNIIHAPYKAGWKGDRFYVEAHLPLEETPRRAVQMRKIINQSNKRKIAYFDWNIADKIAQEHVGLPILIGGSTKRIKQQAKKEFVLRSYRLKGYKVLPLPF